MQMIYLSHFPLQINQYTSPVNQFNNNQPPNSDTERKEKKRKKKKIFKKHFLYKYNISRFSAKM